MSRGRPNFVMLDATHRVLADHPGAHFSAIDRHLRDRGLNSTRQNAREYVLQLQKQGIINEERTSLITPLYAAYLLVDLPDPVRRPILEGRMRAHDASVKELAKTGNRAAPRYQQLPLFLLRGGSHVEDLLGRPNVLVRTRASVTSLRELERTCRELGARVHAAVLVVTEAA